MWSVKPEYQRLYGMVAAATLFLGIAALGGGVWEQETHWMLQWQHSLFDMLCHQIPDRSYWIAGQPMAVCSRCLGFYMGMLSGILLLPLISSVSIMRRDRPKWVLGTVAMINLVDILGNMLSFWQNTLNSRFGLGLLLGLSAAAVMVALLTTNKRTENLRYGTA